MEVVQGITALSAGSGPLFVVVGVFDGMHRGHAFLVRHLRREAERRAARPTVITFDAHPDAIIRGQAPPLLCDPEERLDRLGAAGVAVTVVQHFDAALRVTPYDAFVAAITERVELAGFLMTSEAAFGYERKGTPAALAELGARQGFDVVTVPAFTIDGRPVSSTDIRTAIGLGDLALARTLLGRAAAVTGTLEPASDGAFAVRFAVPVVLPGRGRYRAVIETPGMASGRRAVAESRNGSLVVRPSTPGIEAGRARIRFVGGSPEA